MFNSFRTRAHWVAVLGIVVARAAGGVAVAESGAGGGSLEAAQEGGNQRG
jgi:hypothetical protein